MIFVIARGFVGDEASNNAWKRCAREVLTIAYGEKNCDWIKRRPSLFICYDKDTNMLIVPNHDDPLLVKAFINTKDLQRLLVDTCNSIDIMFYDFFKNLRIRRSELLLYNEDLIGFSNHLMTPIGYVKLHLTFGKSLISRKNMVRFIVVKL